MGMSEQLRSKPKIKTRDLIGYLLGHGARAWRSSLPPASPAVRAMTPSGRLAVKIRFQ